MSLAWICRRWTRWTAPLSLALLCAGCGTVADVGHAVPDATDGQRDAPSTAASDGTAATPATDATTMAKDTPSADEPPRQPTIMSGPEAAAEHPPVDVPASGTVTEGLVVGRSQSIEPGDKAIALVARDLISMTPGTERWRVVAGDRIGSELLRIRTPSELHGAEIADTWSRADGSEEVIETYLLKARPDGSIVMPATLTRRDHAVSEFEPALSIAPPELRPSPPRDSTGDAEGGLTSRSRMTVVEEDSPRRVKEKGTATRELRIVDRVAISTPLGEFDAIRVSIEFRAKLSMASVREIATQYVVPGLGVVAESRREDVRAIGLFSRTTEQTIVRLTR